MPNEKINDHVSPGWYTEVSWRRRPGLDPDDQGTASGHVQLATVNVHSPFEFPEREHGDSWEAGERFDGWRVTLDEAGIDRLIRTLHKAKRQAFGGPDDGHTHTLDCVRDGCHIPSRFATGGLVPVGQPVQLDDDECVIKRDEHGVWLCHRAAHDGRPCRTEGVTLGHTQ